MSDEQLIDTFEDHFLTRHEPEDRAHLIAGLRAVGAAVRADQIEKDAAHILVVAAENAKAQRESDLIEGIKPIGTSTPLEAEWYQYGNWAAAAIRAQLEGTTDE